MNQTNQQEEPYNHDKVGYCQDYNTLFRLFRDTANWIGAMMELIAGSDIDDLTADDLEFIMNVTAQLGVIDSVIENDLAEARATAYRIIEEIHEKLENGEEVNSPLAEEIEEWRYKLDDIHSEEAFPKAVRVDYVVDGLVTYKIVEAPDMQSTKQTIDYLRL